MIKSNIIDISGAAIVSPLIAKKQQPITYGYRDEPIDPADSGWQFMTNEEVPAGDIKIWSINEVVEYEPSLEKYIYLPVGTKLTRDDVGSEWVIHQESRGCS